MNKLPIPDDLIDPRRPLQEQLGLNIGREPVRGAVGQTFGRPPRISGTFDPALHQEGLRRID
ncbi:MAG: hypothetical protein V1936_04590 [Patescibacteria group bacterium]